MRSANWLPRHPSVAVGPANCQNFRLLPLSLLPMPLKLPKIVVVVYFVFCF